MSEVKAAVSETKTQEPEVFMSAELEAKFIDVIRTEATPERLVLNLVQVLPPNEEGRERAKVVFRAVLSWPHIARTRNLLTRLLEKHGPVALKVLNDAMTPEEPEAPAPDEQQ